MRLAIVAPEPEARLCGYEGRLPGGEARVFATAPEAAGWEPHVTAALPDWPEPLLPAADALFDLRPGDPAAVLVAGGGERRRAALLSDLGQRGIEARGAEALESAALEAAGVVVLLAEGFPPLAPAVLAAGRLLVAPRARPAFAFQPGIDHLGYDNDSQAAQAANSAVAAPDAFQATRVLGRRAARPHRASAVYGRLLVDAELTAPPRSAEPRG